MHLDLKTNNMKKYLLMLTKAILIMIVFIFNSCKKNSFDVANSETNLQIVPQAFAKVIAEKFNPTVYFQNQFTSLSSLRKGNTNASTNSAFNVNKKIEFSDFIHTKLNGNNIIDNYFVVNDSAGIAALYVFNFIDNQGTLIVSADFKINPIVAYIEHGQVPQNFTVPSPSVPFGLTQWERKTLSEYALVRKGKYDNSKIAYAAWWDYIKKNNITVSDAIIGLLPPPDDNGGNGGNGCAGLINNGYGPWLTTTWGQSCTYNDQCPIMNCIGCDQNALTGCVATAMAQVIRSWGDFGLQNNYNYNFAAMPVAQGNGEVQRLMHDAGTNVSMMYGCNSSGVLISNIPNVANVLKNQFGFTVANYVSGFDLNRCIVNVSSGWPVLLGGVDPALGEGHEWVCDGYSQLTNTCIPIGVSGNIVSQVLHMNWGWHEVGTIVDFNGWFSTTDWTTMGGNFNPSSQQCMIAEIHIPPYVE